MYGIKNEKDSLLCDQKIVCAKLNFFFEQLLNCNNKGGADDIDIHSSNNIDNVQSLYLEVEPLIEEHELEEERWEIQNLKNH